MTTDTKAVARWDVESQDSRDCNVFKRDDGDYVRFTDHEQVVAELTSKVHELERLCDATYVQNGADAYNHACDLIEQLQSERIAAGRDPGTEGSLCDGLTWAYGELMEAESEIDTLRSALAAKSAEVEGYKDALDAIANHYDMDGYGERAWKDLAIEMAERARAAMEKSNEHQD